MQTTDLLFPPNLILLCWQTAKAITQIENGKEYKNSKMADRSRQHYFKPQ